MSEQLKTTSDQGRIESNEIRSDEILDDFSKQMYDAMMEKEARDTAAAAEAMNSAPELTDENSIDGITTSERDFSDAMREAMELAESNQAVDATAEAQTEVDQGLEESNEVHSDEITGEPDMSELMNQATAQAEAMATATAEANAAAETTEVTPELTDENSIDSITTSERDFSDAMREAMELAESNQAVDATAEAQTEVDQGLEESNEVHSDEITGEPDMSELMNQATAQAEVNAVAEAAEANSAPEITDENSIDGITTSERDFSKEMQYQGVYGQAIKLGNIEKSKVVDNPQGAYAEVYKTSPESNAEKSENHVKRLKKRIGRFTLGKMRVRRTNYAS